MISELPDSSSYYSFPELPISKREMLVGGSPSGGDGGAAVRGVCVPRRAAGGRGAAGARDRARSIRPVRAEATAHLPDMRTG